MWYKTHASYRDFDGRFIKIFPFRSFDLTTPGHGDQPGHCRRDKLLYYGMGDDIGKAFFGWVSCNEGACPECAPTWVFTYTHHALSQLLACQFLHPGSKIYSLRFTISDNNVSPDVVSRARESMLQYLKSVPGVFGGVYFLHDFKIRPYVEKRMRDTLTSLHGYPPARSELYDRVADIDFLHSLGFGFTSWRQAILPHFHFHVFVVADHCPIEISLHGNSNKSKRFGLCGGLAVSSGSGSEKFIPRKSLGTIPPTTSSALPTTRPDGSTAHWYITTVQRPDYTKQISGDDLVRYVRYVIGHCTVSNTRGLVIRTLNSFGGCHGLKLDYNSDGDHNWIDYTEYNESCLVSYVKSGSGGDAVDFRCDSFIYSGDRDAVIFRSGEYKKKRFSAVSNAFDLMVEAGLPVKWVGVRVYPSWDAPTFNEDLPSNGERPLPENLLPASAFDIPFETVDGVRIESAESDPTHDRIRLYLTLVKDAGLPPGVSHDDDYSPVQVISDAIRIQNEKRFNRSVKAKSRGVFYDEIPNIDKHELAGLVVHLGRVHKSTFYGVSKLSRAARTFCESVEGIGYYTNGRLNMKHQCVRHLCRSTVNEVYFLNPGQSRLYSPPAPMVPVEPVVPGGAVQSVLSVY